MLLACDVLFFHPACCDVLPLFSILPSLPGGLARRTCVGVWTALDCAVRVTYGRCSLRSYAGWDGTPGRATSVCFYRYPSAWARRRRRRTPAAHGCCSMPGCCCALLPASGAGRCLPAFRPRWASRRTGRQDGRCLWYVRCTGPFRAGWSSQRSILAFVLGAYVPLFTRISTGGRGRRRVGFEAAGSTVLLQDFRKDSGSFSLYLRET
jgi:hypothetical protein